MVLSPSFVRHSSGTSCVKCYLETCSIWISNFTRERWTRGHQLILPLARLHHSWILICFVVPNEIEFAVDNLSHRSRGLFSFGVASRTCDQFWWQSSTWSALKFATTRIPPLFDAAAGTNYFSRNRIRNKWAFALYTLTRAQRASLTRRPTDS